MEEKIVYFSNSQLRDLLKDGLNKGASLRFRVKGWSMFPFIRNGDIVTVISQDNGTFPVGAVVAVALGPSGKLLIHRIVDKHQDMYLIKGDNLFYSDGFAAGKDILGIITMVERPDKKIITGSKIERYVNVKLSRLGIFSGVTYLGKKLPPAFRRLLKSMLNL